MSEASDLIERMERETGQRIDANDGDNMAVAGLFGALSRMLGQHDFDERDDVAVGALFRHQMTPQYEQEQAEKEALIALLGMGLSPDDILKG